MDGAAHPYTPPAPTPRYVPPDAKPSLKGYWRYFRIMARNPLEIFTERNFDEKIQTSKIFGRPFAMVHDPAAIRHYLVQNAANYRLTKLRRLLFEPLIGNGLLIAEGESWKRTRGALTPVFNHRRVRSFAPTMARVIEREADDLARAGDAVNMADRMLTLALNVLTACLFSGDTAIDVERFSRNLDRLLHIAGMPHPLDLANAPDWLPRLGRGEARRVVAEIRDQVGEVVAARRARGADSDGEADFLSLLMNAGAEDGAPLSDKEIIDNLITFLAAGHETTARTLTWTFFLLTKDGEARERAVAEVDAAGLDDIDPADWGKALPFTTAVLKESMRLYPAAAIFSRQSIGPDTLCGVDIAPDTEVVTSPWVLHRHNKLWERPTVFEPERFMGARGEAIDRYAYIPFGAGPRICIGASFSMQEMLIVLGVFLRRLAIADAGLAPPQPVMRITIHPSTPAPMKVSRR